MIFYRFIRSEVAHSCCYLLCTLVAKGCAFLIAKNCALLLADYISVIKAWRAAYPVPLRARIEC